jgi:hypothetical protein
MQQMDTEAALLQANSLAEAAVLSEALSTALNAAASSVPCKHTVCEATLAPLASPHSELCARQLLHHLPPHTANCVRGNSIQHLPPHTASFSPSPTCHGGTTHQQHVRSYVGGDRRQRPSVGLQHCSMLYCTAQQKQRRNSFITRVQQVAIACNTKDTSACKCHLVN